MRIDFKFRRPLLALGGGSASAPAAAVPAAGRRGFSIPFLDRLSLRQRMLVLMSMIAGSLLLAMGFNALDARRSSMLAVQTRLVGESLMHSQRLARNAPLLLNGDAKALSDFGDSRVRLALVVGLLQSGGEIDDRRVKPLSQTLAQEITAVTGLWTLTDAAATILQNEGAALAATASASNKVLADAPALADQIDQLMQLATSSGASAADVASLVRLSGLTERLMRLLTQLSAQGGTARTASIEALQTLAPRLGSAVQALSTGTESQRLAPGREAELRKQIGSLSQAYAAIEAPIGKVSTGVPTLRKAGEAAQRIGADSEALRSELLALQSKLLSADAGFSLADLATAAALLVAALAGSGLYFLRQQDVRRQIVEADAQRVKAEAMQRDARRANDQNQSAILRLMNELQDVADGDLTVQATVSEDITGAIADSVNYTVEELRSLVARINITAELVADASASAAAISGGLQKATEKQTREIRETGESVLRMASQISDVSESASESAQVARQALGAAEQGRQAVDKSISGMNGIRDHIQETAKRIKRLGESSQEIGEIVELISDLTEQTNVLALNAAIQAASAGEAGRGFTMVAEEVQRLAERGAEATRQISGLIRTIQLDTQDAVAAMERSTQGVVLGTRLSDDAGNALGEIGRVSRQLAELIEGIARTTQNQAVSAGTVAQSIQRILLVTKQTSDGTQQTAGSIVQLAELGRELKSSVSRFRVS
jgi:twitching motility protein PilJ